MTASGSPQRAAEPRTVPEGRQRAKERTQAVRRAAEALPDGGYTGRTAQGPVLIERFSFHEEDGREWVEVHLGGDVEGGDPHYRIENPPTLVSDPAGDIELATGRYRHDPLAAVAELVAQYGGAQAQRKGLRG